MDENDETIELNEKEIQERERILGFRPQKEVIYNHLLPYASEIDKESNEAFASIKLNLPKAVLAKELRPSATHWTRQLIRYIRLYGMKFSKEDHILFIKLYLQLISIPDVEGSLVELFLTMLNKLLKKRELLSREDLVIEWRPLYELCDRLMASKREGMGLEWYPSSIETHFKQVIRLARVYFRAEATQEMLDEWKPLLCPFDITVSKGLQYMEMFLPTLMSTEHERDVSWRLWFEEMFTFWESIHNGPTYEAMFISLFGRLSLHNTGHIDWEPHCSKILTRLLRTFRLPVGKLNHTAKVSVPLQLDSIARWIVAMMGGPSSKVILRHIASMFKAIESYYYPSNYGKWTINLLNFLLSITCKFVYRIHRERYKKETWEPKIPESHQMTDDDISTFVRTLTPVTFLALYSKLVTSQGCRVLQNLANLRPELVFPELLEKSYVALETLTEPHQLRACLSGLTFAIRAIMRESKWYPEGRSHIIPILFRVLPAIDSNDLPKSLGAFQFISTCFTLLPITDCSDLVQQHPELSEHERALCFATAELPDFIVQFLDRIFTVISTLNVEHSSHSEESGNDMEEKLNPQDAIIVTAITSAVAVTLIQCSEDIYMRSLNQIFRFATTSLLEGIIACGAVTSLCAATAKANPEQAAKKFIPHCCEVIKEIFRENPHQSKEEKADKQLQWNLGILCELCKCCGDQLLKYKDELFEVMELVLQLEAKQGYHLASKFVRECVLTLTTYYEKERKSVDPEAQLVELYLPIKDWGKCVSPKELKMKWHEPSADELKMGFEIIDRFLIAQLETLKEFTNGNKELTKDQLLQCLTIIYNIMVGCNQLMPAGNEDAVEIKSRKNVVELSSWSVKSLAFTEQYQKVFQQRGEKAYGLRRLIFETVRNGLWKIMENREDDVKSISKIVAIYSECLMFHELYKNEFDKHWTVFANGKRAMQDMLRGRKMHQRLLVIDRVILQHQLRTLAFDRSAYTKLTHDAMLDLLKLSMSHYSIVRIVAQRVFFRGMQLNPYKGYEHYLQRVIKSLSVDPVENRKELKGALHLMHGPGGRNTSYLSYLHEWDVIVHSWPALVSASHSDRPSIVKLHDKLVLKIQTTYNTIAVNVQVDEPSLQAAKNLLDSTTQPHVGPVQLFGVDERLARQNAENLEHYNQLVTKLMDAVDTGNLSWRHNHLATGFLMFMLRWDAPLHPRVASHFTTGLIDDALSFRQICVTAVGTILKKLERKRKVIMMTPEEIGGVLVESGPARPGDRPDNKWMQYDSAKVPRTAEEYDSTIFVEKTHWGYYQWPEKLKTYALRDDTYKLDRTRDEMPEEEQILFDKFSDADFVGQLMKLHSLENVKGKDKYDAKKVELFKGLFRNFGDSLVPVFRAELERLAKDSHESCQRCVAEVVSGMVVGTKHWNFDKVNALWEWLIPVLRCTVDNVSIETLKDWHHAYGQMVQNRDPRKLHWLFDFLLENPVSGAGGSFMDASRLFLLQGGVHQQEWRVAELLHYVLNHIEPKLDHQYKNVRDRMGSVMASIFFYDITLLKEHNRISPQREVLMEKVFPRLALLSKEGAPYLGLKTSETDIKGGGSCGQEFQIPELMEDVVIPSAASAAAMETEIIETEVPEHIVQQLQDSLQKMMSSQSGLSDQAKEMSVAKLQQFLPPGVSMEAILDTTSRHRSQLKKRDADMRDEVESTSDDSGASTSGRGIGGTVDEERNSAVRLLKTLMKWIISAQRTSLQPLHRCMLKLLPIICKMSPVDMQGSDEELNHDTQVSLACMAQSYVPPDQLHVVVNVIKQISECTSWHARHTVLKYCQIFIFNNLFTLQDEKECVDILKEVILQLMADEQLEVREMATKTLSGLLQCGLIKIDTRIEKFIDENCKVRVKGLKRRKRTEEKVAAGDEQQLLRKRHAGVLALSACILSSPYSIPEFLPDLLMKLSNHLHDPQPIESTVKKTFSDFRRTHHDSWHQDKLKFTSDQLSILTDLLVSPCYYA